MSDETKNLSCSDCGLINCYRQEKSFPQFCLTTNTDQEIIEDANRHYLKDEFVAKFSHAAAEIEGTYFGKITRVEEIVLFAKRIEAKKIGIATCVGLMNEAKTFAKILKAKGLESYCVICKVSSTDKTAIGIDEKFKIKKDTHESLCNPVLQAKLLNKEKTDLNVIVGLCVGHDSIFIKYSDAPVTTLITKDRVLAHNPAGALYTSGFYYTRLLEENDTE
ncbi:uncharacterized metal-binding protein [Desulfosporosinus orientis DSM 765]|uniref:Uncharacterized metal-binding protein n=1 Tax=Desulfosporosinus orientis (strain ATCC 19365 / DSM 765 / NCIMB 8382 / VKM B-1628 / Singapore I) TaxID=768706 RepID=G7W9A2_DESOD|nr:DUF1847 domain-containing protein [Desulfosporosinus orientis]AET68743.1 uncharacterized metal-binding protein [Desulfosporosinus orientis DSM 765]